MSKVSPIVDKRDLKRAEAHLKKHFDEAYYLIWRIGVETGLRITDITELKYHDINFDSGKVRVMENKGTRARKTKAKMHVLKQVKQELLTFFQGSKRLLLKIHTTSATDILNVLPSTWKKPVASRLNEAEMRSAPRWREAYISPQTLRRLKKRQAHYQSIDGGWVFARRTFTSNRVRNQTGVISRQACWKVFSQLTSVLNRTKKTALKIGCHSMRKSFARHLYLSSGKDICLLMEVIGHQSVATTLRYIGVKEDEACDAQLSLHRYLA